MLELLKMDAREWPYILLGIMGSLIEESAFPLFDIFFGEMLRVSCCRCCGWYCKKVLFCACTDSDVLHCCRCLYLLTHWMKLACGQVSSLDLG